MHGGKYRTPRRPTTHAGKRDGAQDGTVAVRQLEAGAELLISRARMRAMERDLTTSSSPPGITAMSNEFWPSRSRGKSNATGVKRCRPSLVAFQPSAHREHTAAAAPSASCAPASVAPGHSRAALPRPPTVLAACAL